VLRPRSHVLLERVDLQADGLHLIRQARF
jgi:hypothetical protein